MKPQALRFHLCQDFASTRDPQNSFRALKRNQSGDEKNIYPSNSDLPWSELPKKHIKILRKHLGAERPEAFPEVTPPSHSPQGLPDTRDVRSCTGPHVSRQAQNVEDEAENHDVHSERSPRLKPQPVWFHDPSQKNCIPIKSIKSPLRFHVVHQEPNLQGGPLFFEGQPSRVERSSNLHCEVPLPHPPPQKKKTVQKQTSKKMIV